MVFGIWRKNCRRSFFGGGLKTFPMQPNRTPKKNWADIQIIQKILQILSVMYFFIESVLFYWIQNFSVNFHGKRCKAMCFKWQVNGSDYWIKIKFIKITNSLADFWKSHQKLNSLQTSIIQIKSSGELCFRA